ncbi:MAG: uracil-DNA glycosylase [Lachnospiraceae bacterium]|nr:uracil-DNA glycosylase [Lachnospiraceae bacterium]
MIENEWLEYLKPEFSKPYYRALYNFVKEEYSSREIFPPSDKIFSALEHTSVKDVKVVIIGQDPYHEPGQAHGMSFSVLPGVKTPPSLQNMYKELNSELGCYIPNNGYLVKWADQGVLLLNAVLTVRSGAANSHKGKGWEQFTDAVIRAVNAQNRPVVYLLWGSNARAKKALINNPKHLVLETVHPSPLSAYNGFFGCGHFKKANEFLEENGLKPIDWQIENI